MLYVVVNCSSLGRNIHPGSRNNILGKLCGSAKNKVDLRCLTLSLVNNEITFWILASLDAQGPSYRYSLL